MTAVGLIGCGRWGRLILRDLLTLGAEVHVAVPGVEGRRAALDVGAATAVPDLTGLPAVDGYVVATPTATHAAVIEALIPTRRPIFVEKPLASHADAARRIVERAGDRVYVMDKWRYHPGVEALAERAKSGALGEILAVRTYRLGWGNPHADVDACWILLPHDLSIALEILGSLPEPRAAIAMVPRRAGSNLLTILHDGAAGPQVTSEISADHPAARRAVIVFGSRANAQLVDSYDDRILIAEHGETSGSREIQISTDMPLLKELTVFLAHLSGGPPPRSSAAEGLLIVERVQALRAMAGLAAT